MTRIAMIVEGKGDVRAGPSLLCKSAAVFGLHVVVTGSIIRAGEAKKLRRAGEFERFVELAATREDADEVFVLLDLDDGCAAEFAAEFQKRAESLTQRFNKVVRVCFCVREFECWFLSQIARLREALPEYGISPQAAFPNASGLRGAKEALNAVCHTKHYKPMRDQLLFAQKIDVIELARLDRSFRKFLKEATQTSYPELDKMLCQAVPCS